MRTIRVRSDFTVRLPKEVRGRVRPGDRLEVVVAGGRVTYIIPSEPGIPTMGEIIDRVRQNPVTNPPSAEEIEEIIHQVRAENPSRDPFQPT